MWQRLPSVFRAENAFRYCRRKTFLSPNVNLETQNWTRCNKHLQHTEYLAAFTSVVRFVWVRGVRDKKWCFVVLFIFFSRFGSFSHHTGGTLNPLNSVRCVATVSVLSNVFLRKGVKRLWVIGMNSPRTDSAGLRLPTSMLGLLKSILLRMRDRERETHFRNFCRHKIKTLIVRRQIQLYLI